MKKEGLPARLTEGTANVQRSRARAGGLHLLLSVTLLLYLLSCCVQSFTLFCNQKTKERKKKKKIFTVFKQRVRKCK